MIEKKCRHTKWFVLICSISFCESSNVSLSFSLPLLDQGMISLCHSQFGFHSTQLHIPLTAAHTIKTKRDTLQIDDQTGNQPLNQICNLTLSTTHHWIPFNFDLPQSGLESNCIRIQISIALCSSGSGSSITPVCVFGNRRVSLQPELRWKSHQIGSILNPGGRTVSYYRRVLEKLGS